MFWEISLRTTEEPWRKNGVGSCVIPTYLAQGGLNNDGGRLIRRLQEEVNAVYPGQSTTLCVFHRSGIGCILDDLKGPVCMAHVDNPTEIKTRFGVTIPDTSIMAVLMDIAFMSPYLTTLCSKKVNKRLSTWEVDSY